MASFDNENLVILVVDDEMPARRHIVERLRESVEKAEIIEADNGHIAIEVIRVRRPNLVILDVQMPGLTGLDVLREVDPDDMPPTIFVTAYDQHSVEAFEAGTLDYLLKPFSDARFEAALLRATRRLEDDELRRFGRETLRLLAHPGSSQDVPLDRLLVRKGAGVQIVPTAEIDAVIGAGDYVLLRLDGNELLHRASLTELALQLG